MSLAAVIEKELVRPEVAGVRLNCSTATVYRWLASSRLKGYRVANRCWLIYADSIAAVARELGLEK
jgi:hypothetical protein